MTSRHLPATWGARRASAVLSVIMLLFAGIIILYTARTTQRLHQQVQSNCQFDSDIGGAPITVVSPARRPSLLGVKIVSDSRVAFHIAACPGSLAPAAPSFIRWARYYHLPTG